MDKNFRNSEITFAIDRQFIESNFLGEIRTGHWLKINWFESHRDRCRQFYWNRFNIFMFICFVFFSVLIIFIEIKISFGFFNINAYAKVRSCNEKYRKYLAVILNELLASRLPSLFVILYFSTSGTSLSKQAFPRFVSCIRVERIVLVSNNLRIIRNICILKRLENLIKHLLNMDRDYKCIFNIQCKIVSLYLISSSRTKKLG